MGVGEFVCESWTVHGFCVSVHDEIDLMSDVAHGNKMGDPI